MFSKFTPSIEHVLLGTFCCLVWSCASAGPPPKPKFAGVYVSPHAAGTPAVVATNAGAPTNFPASVVTGSRQASELESDPRFSSVRSIEERESEDLIIGERELLVDAPQVTITGLELPSFAPGLPEDLIQPCPAPVSATARFQVTDWYGKPLGSVEASMQFDCRIQSEATASSVRDHVEARATEQARTQLANALAENSVLREELAHRLSSANEKESIVARAEYLERRAASFERRSEAEFKHAKSCRDRAEKIQDKLDLNSGLVSIGDAFSGGADAMSQLNWQMNKTANQFSAKEQQRDGEQLLREAEMADQHAKELKQMAKMTRQQAHSVRSRAG